MVQPPPASYREHLPDHPALPVLPAGSYGDFLESGEYMKQRGRFCTGEGASPVGTPSIPAVYPCVTVAIQG